MLSAKISLWMNIAWALLIVFEVVGILAGHVPATQGLIKITSYWVAVEIINRAIASRQLLKLLKLAKEKD